MALQGSLQDLERQVIEESPAASGLPAKRVKIVESALLTSIDDKSTRAFGTPGNTRPTVTTSSSVVLAANTNRKYACIFNQSGAVIYLKLGAAAVVGQGIRLANDEKFEIKSDNLWTGTIQAIRNAGSGAIEVFEGTV